MKKLLLIIDMQKGFLDLYKDQDQVSLVIDQINAMDDFDGEVAIIIHEYKSLFGTVSKLLMRGAGVNKEDLNLDDRIELKYTNLFTKSSLDILKSSDISKFLNSKKDYEILLSGQDGMFCIKQSAISLKKEGFNIKLIDKAIASFSYDAWVKERDYLREKYQIEFLT